MKYFDIVTDTALFSLRYLDVHLCVIVENIETATKIYILCISKYFFRKKEI